MPDAPLQSGEDGQAPGALTALVGELESVARELRSGALESEPAAELIDACAKTAGAAVAELDRLARAAETSDQAADQLELRST